MTEIINQLELDPDTAIVWGEDFNLIFDTNLDADGGKPQLKVNSLSKLSSITKENDLCDIFRVRCPDEKRFTWRRKNPFKQRQLDHFFISDTLQDTVERIEIIPSVQSDHSTLCLKFSPINERNRGHFHWKFNNSLVYDKNFVSMMRTEIPKFRDESLGIKDAMGRWEFLKYNATTINEIFQRKAAERKSKRISSENSVKQLEIKISTNSNE